MDYLEMVKLGIRKPARYLGPEYFPVGYRPPAPDDLKISLVYPDLYEIGMSNTGLRILYSLLSRMEGVYVDVAFAPWPDMEEALRARSEPLVSRHGQIPLGEFDVLGVSLQFELNYTNILLVLDLAGIPLRAADRTQEAPLVIAGGPCASHPEPVAPFFDAIVIGDGEEALPDFLRRVTELAGTPRDDKLAALALLPGTYVPSLHPVEASPDNGHLLPVGTVIRKQSVLDLDKYLPFLEFPVPALETVFDRLSLELARGCMQGCRFCEAGFTYRPPRERNPVCLLEWAEAVTVSSGFDELSMASLSTADYTKLKPLVGEMRALTKRLDVSMTVSSLRAYGIDDEVLGALTATRVSSLTLAPEAGSQRLRDIINKNVTGEQLLDAVRKIVDRGINRVKLYFMVGLPTETEADLDELVQLVQQCRDIVCQRFKRKGMVVASVSLFVPRPHTPFQWEPLFSREQLRTSIAYLAKRLPRNGVSLKWHSPDMSWLEALLTRADRRVADVIEGAFKHGARFDSWDEHLKMGVWNEAIAAAGLAPEPFLSGAPVEAPLPWDHIQVGVDRAYLARERERGLAAKTTPPCDPFREKMVCFRCGAGCEERTEGRGRRTLLRQGYEGQAPDRGQRTDSKDHNEPRTPVSGTGACAGQSRQAACAPVVSTSRDREGAGAVPQDGDGSEFRYRLTFAKVGPAVLLGHLDLVRHLQLVFRRAGLKLARSRGFNPRPRLYLPPPLPLGCSGLAELVDVMTTEEEEVSTLVSRLNEFSVPGLRFLDAVLVVEGMPKISKAKAADFLLGLDGQGASADLLATQLTSESLKNLMSLEFSSPQAHPGLDLPDEPALVAGIRWSLIDAPRIDRTLQELVPDLEVAWVVRKGLVYAL